MKYFAMLDGEQKGPYTLDELAGAGVTPQTYVWCKGMKDWEKAEDVADICRYFRQRIAAIQHPGTIEIPQAETPAPEKDTPDDGLTDEQRKRLEEIPVACREMVRKSGQIPTEPPMTDDNPDSPPRSWIVPAVIATLFCFPVLGFVAIFFAFQSQTLWRQSLSDMDANTREQIRRKAHEAARRAKMWTGITICAGIMLFGFYIGMR